MESDRSNACENRNVTDAIPVRLVTLVEWLDLSLTDLSALTRREVSRSACHRILRGQHRASGRERSALYSAIVHAMRDRDSFLHFEDS